MATKIVTKNSSTAGSAPLASDLVQGELAVNVTDKRLYTENASGVIVEVGSNPYNFTANHDGSAKLATTSTGIDVTGTATMDGLTVETSTDPASITLRHTGNTSGLIIKNFSGGEAQLVNVDNGPMVFKTNDAERMRISSSGRVGIGTSSPVSELDVAGTTPTITIKDTQNKSWTSSDTTLGELAFRTSDASGIGAHNVAFVRAVNDITSSTTPSGALSFGVALSNSNASEAMRIDSSGNVGIGTSAIDGRLEIKKATASNETILGIEASGVTTGTLGSITYDQSDDSMRLLNNSNFGGTTLRLGTRGADNLVIDYNGNVGIGTSTDTGKLNIYRSGGETQVKIRSDSNQSGNIYFTDDTSGYSGSLSYNHSDNSMRFATNGTGEKMRIDSSGNLLVGKTYTATGNVGQELRAGGYTAFTRSGGNPLELKRLASDGSLINFYKDGTDVGSIGTAGGDLTVGTGDTGITFEDSADVIHPINQGTGVARDNAIDLGKSAARFDDIYATNGTIQTSDRNEKQDIAELSDAEQRVAVACKGLLRKFRWKDSVAEKGDDARIHFGIIAQDLQTAFAAEGLDASDYAMFISTTWTDEETNEEKTRMGVRYSELLAFIIAAI